MDTILCSSIFIAMCSHFFVFQVVAIVDPLQEKAKSVLQVRQNGPHSDMYKECKIYASVPELIQAIKVDAIFIGIPPVFRGSLEKGKYI